MSCRRSTNKLQQVGGRGEKEDSPGGDRCVAAETLLNGHDSGVTIPASSGLAPPASTGLLKTSPILSQPKLPSISSVLVPSDSRILPTLMQPNIPRAVSLETVQQEVEHMSAVHQQHQNTNQVLQQQQQKQMNASSGAQRGNVVGCITTPQGSSHSLHMGSDDLSTSGHQVDRAEFESLFVSPNNGGTWESNDLESELFGPIPPPQPLQPPLPDWSFDFDSSHPKETLCGDFNSEQMVMDVSDVDNSLRSTETEGEAAAGANPIASARSVSSSADAGAGSWHEQGGSQNQSLSTEGMLPMEEVVIEPSPKECDFEGRPAPTSISRSSTLSFPDGLCHMVFTGLGRTGHDFGNLRVTAHFGIGSVHKVGESTGPIKIGSDGRAYATVCYPSMREISPELDSAGNIQVIQVDIVVEIRSDCAKYQYVGPQLKIAYCRGSPTEARPVAAEPELLLQGRRIPSRAPTPYTGDNPQTSQACEDYSCFERLADMCHSIFRGSGVAHKPSPDDPNDLMNVNP